MKKLLLVLAIGAFAACNSANTDTKAVDSAATVKPVDSTVAAQPVDSTAKAPVADSTKKDTAAVKK